MWNIPHTIGMIMMKDNVTKPTLGCATHSGSTRHRGGDLNAHWPVQWHAVSSRWLEQCYVLPRGKSSPAPEGWRTWLPWKLEPVTWNRLPATLGASSDYTASHLCTTTICIGEKVSDFFYGSRNLHITSVRRFQLFWPADLWSRRGWTSRLP